MLPQNSSWSSCPCTNCAVKCPGCPFVVQSYSMAEHYRIKHPEVTMSHELQEAVRLRPYQHKYTAPLLKTFKNTARLPGNTGVGN